MNRPRMTESEVRLLIPKETADAYKVVIVAVRGYYKKTMGDPTKNDRGIYDDAIFALAPGLFIACNGNTDPSRFTPGIATLVPGVHLYKKGKHGISHADGGYPAFRPASPDEGVPVTRDGQTGVSRGIAINIHHGGYSSTSSLGCQTIHPDQWHQFQTEVYAAMDRAGQGKLIPYVLVEA